MADKVRYSVSVTPLEDITDEQSNTYTIIAGEIGQNLGGSGEAPVVDYSASASDQGYKDGAVNYLEAPDGAGLEVAISSESTASFVFIKNTGFVFSSTTVLGAVNTTRRVKVTVNSGAIILAILEAGGCYVASCPDITTPIVASGIKVETVNNDGTEVAGGDHLAVEYLVVD